MRPWIVIGTRCVAVSNAARTSEQVSMMQPLLLKCMRERTHDMILSDQTVEIPGAVLAG